MYCIVIYARRFEKRHYSLIMSACQNWIRFSLNFLAIFRLAETTPESNCSTCSSSSEMIALGSTGTLSFWSPPVELPPWFASSPPRRRLPLSSPLPSSWAYTTMATRRTDRMKNFIWNCFWLALSNEVDTLMLPDDEQMRQPFIPDFEYVNRSCKSSLAIFRCFFLIFTSSTGYLFLLITHFSKIYNVLTIWHNQNCYLTNHVEGTISRLHRFSYAKLQVFGCNIELILRETLQRISEDERGLISN